MKTCRPKHVVPKEAPPTAPKPKKTIQEFKPWVPKPVAAPVTEPKVTAIEPVHLKVPPLVKPKPQRKTKEESPER